MKQIGLLTNDNDFEYTFRSAMVRLDYVELSIFREIDILLEGSLLDVLVIDCDVEIEDEIKECTEQLRSRFSKIILFSEDYNIHQFSKMKSIYPIGYLEKQTNQLQIIQAVDLALWEKKITNEHPDYYFNEIQEKIFVKVGSAYKTLLIEEVKYIFSKEKMNYLKTNNREYPTSELIKNLSVDLFPYFIRVHRSYLVNANLIEKINLKEDYLEIADTHIPIGKTYKKNIFENLNIVK